jgi:hypothetical protein
LKCHEEEVMESRNEQRPAPEQPARGVPRQQEASQRTSAEPQSEPPPPPSTPTQEELDRMAEGTYNPTEAQPPEAAAEAQKRERDALEAKHKREREQLEQRQRAMNPQAGGGYTTR